ncbi:MAG: zinc metalloprotease HtpX [Myxococcota bacterium]
MLERRLQQHRLGNLLRSAALLTGLGAVLALLGWVLGGGLGLALALGAVAGFGLFGPRVPTGWLLQMQGARPLAGHVVPGLHAEVAALATRAGVPTPRLYLVPAPAPNAFATGQGRDLAIGLTPPLLRLLDRRELRGVLAHEISHIAAQDTTVMRYATLIAGLTRGLSRLGLWLAILQLPLVLFGAPAVPWSVVLLLWAAPVVSGALNLALSRTREHEADRSAVRLTGDAPGLASALAKLEAFERRQRRWLPFRAPEMPGWLRSHPETGERIARLRELAQAGARPRSAARRGPPRPPRRGPIVRVVARPPGFMGA